MKPTALLFVLSIFIIYACTAHKSARKYDITVLEHHKPVINLDSIYIVQLEEGGHFAHNSDSKLREALNLHKKISPVDLLTQNDLLQIDYLSQKAFEEYNNTEAVKDFEMRKEENKDSISYIKWKKLCDYMHHHGFDTVLSPKIYYRYMDDYYYKITPAYVGNEL